MTVGTTEQESAAVVGGEATAGGTRLFGSGARGSFKYSVRPMVS